MFKIGQSTDIHALVANRKLILGGIEIPYDYGLLGHSDADVLLHVVAESILGALGLGDLGEHFADTDAKHKGMSSRTIVAHAVKEMQKRGYSIGNIDTLILCQKPKLLDYKPAMRAEIAAMLEVDLMRVNIKATTGEKMGPVGRGEGIMAQAVVLLERVRDV